MKRNSIFKFSAFALMVFLITSCLDGNTPNLPPGAGGGSFLVMTYNTGANSAATNSGLVPSAFASCALNFPLTDPKDSVYFAVALQGPTLGKDVGVNIVVDNNRLADNLGNDSLVYVPLPDSTYTLEATSGVIAAGKTYAEFKLIVYPDKIDGTQNYMLPLTAQNNSNLKLMSNLQTIYVHTIGNPIAGAYNWDFIRCSTPSCSAGPDGQTFYGHTTLMAPTTPTTVRVKTGYYTQPDYIITFANQGGGVLGNFKAVIDPDAVTNSWNPAGVYVASGPTILAENNYTKFTCHYTTLTRNCTDIYYK